KAAHGIRDLPGRSDGASQLRASSQGLVPVAVLRIVLVALAASPGWTGNRRSWNAAKFADRFSRLLVCDAGAAAEAETAGQSKRGIERRIPPLVLDIELEPVVVEKSHDVGPAPERGAMGSSASLGVYALDVISGREQQADGLDRFLLRLIAARHVLFARGHVRRHHDRIDLTARGDGFRVGALREQHLDDGHISGFGGPQKRRRASPQDSITAAIEFRSIGNLRAQRDVHASTAVEESGDDVHAAQRVVGFTRSGAVGRGHRVWVEGGKESGGAALFLL